MEALGTARARREDDPSAPHRNDSLRAPGALSPRVAFALVGALLGVVVLAAMASSGERRLGAATAARPSAGSTPLEDTSSATPSDAEAIERFERLYHLWLRAYRQRDASLIPLFAAPDTSGRFDEMDGEIARLNRDGVLDRSRTQTRAISIDLLTADEIRIRLTTLERPRFVDEGTGRNLTLRRGSQVVHAIWTMRVYEGGWRLYESLVTHVERARRRR